MNRQQSAPHRVLFLCTGNYYRSRFAEILFNDLAARSQLNWTAFSRALAINRGAGNIGAISQHTRDACTRRGILIAEPVAFPRGASNEDFAAATRVIALKESEHRHYIEKEFPDWAGRLQYWHVDDRDIAPPQEACAQIEKHVRDLIAELRHV
jgi:protein-tyrosine phosphatase